MPVRSLNSSVFKWPNREQVEKALLRWINQEVDHHPEVVRLGCFGSYARGDWGVGSDLDLITIVTHSTEAFERRPLEWKFDFLPVATEMIIYTENEWLEMKKKGKKFITTLEKEVLWIYP
jgi:predicted nucleotidyltransferase